MSMSKTERVTLRLTATEKEAASRAARVDGRSLSNYARRALLHQIARDRLAAQRSTPTVPPTDRM